MTLPYLPQFNRNRVLIRHNEERIEYNKNGWSFLANLPNVTRASLLTDEWYLISW